MCQAHHATMDPRVPGEDQALVLLPTFGSRGGQLAKPPSKRRQLLEQEAPQKRYLPLNFALNPKLL